MATRADLVRSIRAAIKVLEEKAGDATLKEIDDTLWCHLDDLGLADDESCCPACGMSIAPDADEAPEMVDEGPDVDGHDEECTKKWWRPGTLEPQDDPTFAGFAGDGIQ